MSVLEIVKQKYLGTTIESSETTGIIDTKLHNLDCNCIDGQDCSSGEWTGDCDD